MAASGLAQVPDVDIDADGVFKYVLIRVRAAGPEGAPGPAKDVVRGYGWADYHDREPVVGQGSSLSVAKLYGARHTVGPLASPRLSTVAGARLHPCTTSCATAETAPNRTTLATTKNPRIWEPPSPATWSRTPVAGGTSASQPTTGCGTGPGQPSSGGRRPALTTPGVPTWIRTNISGQGAMGGRPAPHSDLTWSIHLGWYMVIGAHREKDATTVVQRTSTVHEAAPACEMHLWYRGWGEGEETPDPGELLVEVTHGQETLMLWQSTSPVGDFWKELVVPMGRVPGSFWAPRPSARKATSAVPGEPAWSLTWCVTGKMIAETGWMRIRRRKHLALPLAW